MSDRLSNLTSQLSKACEACNLMLSISAGLEEPTSTEIPTETPTEDPTAEPTDSPLTKLKNIRIQNAAKADPNWCCAQDSPSAGLSANIVKGLSSSFGTSGLTNAGIDPFNCLECCGKSPEDYWWEENQICPKAKCERISFLKNNVLNQHYFFHSNETAVETMPLNIVINGKLVQNFPFLKHYSIEEGNGRRLFRIPNGSNAAFYTGGDTLL
jgi:hypothetical protein